MRHLFLLQLELIVDSETGFASSTNILNLVDQLKGKKMRKKEAEQVLQKFVQSKWLIEVPEGLPSGSLESGRFLLCCKLSVTYEECLCFLTLTWSVLGATVTSGRGQNH